MITVLINCKQCDVENERVTVRSRYENEELAKFVEEVHRRVYTDHRNRHPYCLASVDVKIPVKEKGVGY